VLFENDANFIIANLPEHEIKSLCKKYPLYSSKAKPLNSLTTLLSLSILITKPAFSKSFFSPEHSPDTALSHSQFYHPSILYLGPATILLEVSSILWGQMEEP